MEECAAEWKGMKANNLTNGMKYRDFSKQCMSGGEACWLRRSPPPPPAAESENPRRPQPKKPTGRTAGDDRARARLRRRVEGSQAAGKIPAGQKWPQYWSECNKRKKAEGMWLPLLTCSSLDLCPKA